MQDTIARLSELFKQREAIDCQIVELIGGRQEAPAEKPKRKPIKKPVANKWSKKFDKCVDCGTTKTPHRSNGRCKTCYNKWNNKNQRKKKNAEPVDDYATSSAGKKYKCEECDNVFFSFLDYRDVRCECGSKRVITLPQS